MKQILVIEDELMIRQNIVEILELEDYEVLEAANGQKGIELALQHKPNLILCDIRMPQVDGYEVLEKLRLDTTTVNIPFVFITAKASKSDIEKGISLGVDDYLTKPFQIADLLDIVSKRT